MVLGFDEYISGLLLEAKSPEEVVRVLSLRYKEIPEDLIKKLVEVDPTKKKSYSAWVLRVENNPRKIEQYIDSGKLAKIFKYFQENANNGASLVDKPSLKDAEQYLPDFIDIFTYDDEDEDANDFEIKFRSPEWIVAVPHTLAASKKLGKDTYWCTADAYGNGYHYFPQYNNEGPLWINYDLRREEQLRGVTYPFKRYQFSFETNTFLDANDKAFDWDDMDMPQDVQEFYEQEGYDLTKLTMSEEERYERYDAERFENGIFLVDSLYLLTSFNRDYEFNEDDIMEIYDTDNDTVDSPYAGYYDKDSVMYIEDDHKFAVLRDNNNEYTIVFGKRQEQVQDGAIEYELLNGGDNGIVWFGPRYVMIYDSVNRNFDCTELKIEINDYENCKIEENLLITNVAGYPYFEISKNDGTHSLYAYCNGKLVDVVPFDIPENGKYFEVADDETIHGRYRKRYKLANEEIEKDDEYTPESYLNDNSFLVCKKWGPPELEDYVFNVFTVGENGETIKMFDEDFESIRFDRSLTNGFIVVRYFPSEKYCVLSLETGKPMSGMYDAINVGGTSESPLVVAANKDDSGGYENNQRFIITGNEDIEVMEVRNLAVNDRCIVKINTEEGPVWKILSIKEKTFYPDWKIEAIQTANIPSRNKGLSLVTTADGEKVLYDFVSNKVIARHLSKDESPFTTIGVIVVAIKYEDGTYNVMQKGPNQAPILPKNAQSVNAYVLSTSESVLTAKYENEIILYMIYNENLESYTEPKEIVRMKNGPNVRVVDFSSYTPFQICYNDDICFTLTRLNNISNLEDNILYCRRASYGNWNHLSDAPPEIKQFASEVFSLPTAAIQAINERMNRIRKL